MFVPPDTGASRRGRNRLEQNTISVDLGTDFAMALEEVVTDWGHGSRDHDELLAALLAMQAQALAAGDFSMRVLVGLAWQRIGGVPYGSIPERLAA